MNLRPLLDRYFIKNPALRRWVTRVIEGDKDRDIRLLGEELRINSVREHGYLRASRTATWSSVYGEEVPVLFSLASLIPFIDTVADAGANIGLFSRALARFQYLYPQLHIAAFEADPETFQRLQHNLSAPRQQAWNVALSNAPGTLSFVRGSVSHVTTVRERANAYNLEEGFEIECRRLDSFDLPGQRILLKIDVEGQEWKVLQGAQQWFTDQRCVGVYIDGFENREEIYAFFGSHDFELFDGRTMQPANPYTFALLALRRDWLASFTTLPPSP